MEACIYKKNIRTVDSFPREGKSQGVSKRPKPNLHNKNIIRFTVCYSFASIFKMKTCLVFFLILFLTEIVPDYFINEVAGGLAFMHALITVQLGTIVDKLYNRLYRTIIRLEKTTKYRDTGGKGKETAYSTTLITCLCRTPNVGTVGRQQE